MDWSVCPGPFHGAVKWSKTEKNPLHSCSVCWSPWPRQFKWGEKVRCLLQRCEQKQGNHRQKCTSFTISLTAGDGEVCTLAQGGFAVSGVVSKERKAWGHHCRLRNKSQNNPESKGAWWDKQGPSNEGVRGPGQMEMRFVRMMETFFLWTKK